MHNALKRYRKCLELVTSDFIFCIYPILLQVSRGLSPLGNFPGLPFSRSCSFSFTLLGHLAFGFRRYDLSKYEFRNERRLQSCHDAAKNWSAVVTQQEWKVCSQLQFCCVAHQKGRHHHMTSVRNLPHLPLPAEWQPIWQLANKLYVIQSEFPYAPVTLTGRLPMT